jgi:hypothetical protein
MNWKRIILGGLVAGLVLNVGEFAIEPLLGQHMETFFSRLGLPAPGESAMLAIAGGAFLLGIITVWLYAAIRPRYGPGAQTAICAGITVWLLSCLLPNVALYAFGVIGGATLFWIWTLWPLAESVIAALIGARIYRERPDERRAAVTVRA